MKKAKPILQLLLSPEQGVLKQKLGMFWRPCQQNHYCIKSPTALQFIGYRRDAGRLSVFFYYCTSQSHCTVRGHRFDIGFQLRIITRECQLSRAETRFLSIVLNLGQNAAQYWCPVLRPKFKVSIELLPGIGEALPVHCCGKPFNGGEVEQPLFGGEGRPLSQVEQPRAQFDAQGLNSIHLNILTKISQIPHEKISEFFNGSIGCTVVHVAFSNFGLGDHFREHFCDILKCIE